MKIRAFAIVLVLVPAVWILVYHFPSLKQASTWQRQTSPGLLSAGHASLDNRCSACHTPVKGVEASNCVVCHANNEALLQRQSTAFHANVANCAECHWEHRGRNAALIQMDHTALARVGLRQLEHSPADSENTLVHHELVSWIARQTSGRDTATTNPHLTPMENVLDCYTCHATKDRHFTLFGKDCSECHATAKWTIPEFVHPSPRSLDCAQCHQAPPSHYMEHFAMISERVAGQEHAQVNQCYLCHQTTSWNDIRGVGFYKHH